MRHYGWIWRTYCAVLVILSTSFAAAAAWEESPKVAELFKTTEVNGTFVLYDVTANSYTGHDRARAEKRYVPASTFKIPNSLIGLSVGAVKNIDEVIPYRSQVPPFIRRGPGRAKGLNF